MATEKRESGRVREVQQKRVLDEAARRRRARKALEALEQDNFQDDPHADLKMSKKAPRFEESMELDAKVNMTSKKKRRSKGEYLKQRFKKNFSALIEEEQMGLRESPNYLTACAEPSRFPERHFCAVCGFPSNYKCVQCGTRYCSVKCLGTHRDTRFPSNYKCVQCGTRYCSVKCLGTHRDTRCLKWTA